jgi:hypothetical protein
MIDIVNSGRHSLQFLELFTKSGTSQRCCIDQCEAGTPYSEAGEHRGKHDKLPVGLRVVLGIVAPLVLVSSCFTWGKGLGHHGM